MDGYTPAQAAATTGLHLAAVHKAIDSRLILPRTAPHGAQARRLLSREQLLYLQLEADGVRLLPVGTQREIGDSIQRSPRTEKLPITNGPAVVIEVGSARRRVERLMREPARLTSACMSRCAVWPTGQAWKRPT